MGQLTENFFRSEFRCKCGCGFDTVDVKLVRILQELRDYFTQMLGVDCPVKVVSGCRCQKHNRKVGGATGSQHLFGRAADIVVEGVEPAEVGRVALQLGAMGVGVYKGWVHIDTRTAKKPATWGTYSVKE